MSGVIGMYTDCNNENGLTIEYSGVTILFFFFTLHLFSYSFTDFNMEAKDLVVRWIFVRCLMFKSSILDEGYLRLFGLHKE